MNKRFVATRTLQVFSAAFLALSLTYLVKGQAWVEVLENAAIWSLISTLVFAVSMIYYQKTKAPCEVCMPAPDAQES